MISTVGATVAVVSPITALSLPSGETLPALSVSVAFTSIVPPSAGRGYSNVRLLPSICACVSVIGAWPVTVSTSPATAPAGSVTFTPTVPLISVVPIVPSLFASSVISTVGATVAVVSGEPSTGALTGTTCVSSPPLKTSSATAALALSNSKFNGSTLSLMRNNRTNEGPPSAPLPLSPAAVSSSRASRLPPWLIAWMTRLTSAPPTWSAASVASGLSAPATSASTVSTSLARRTRLRPSSLASSTRLPSAAKTTSPS